MVTCFDILHFSLLAFVNFLWSHPNILDLFRQNPSICTL